MNIPSTARYAQTIRSASQFLVFENVQMFPVNPFQICQRNGWHVEKYSVLAAKLGVTVQKICTVLGSKDGVSIKKGQEYHILYNDTGNTQERIRFTVTHEIGHVYLGHLEFVETSLGANLTKEEYQVLENEANAFVRNVLSPASLIQEFRIAFDIDTVSKYFCISRHAAQVRMQLLDSDLICLSS